MARLLKTNAQIDAFIRAVLHAAHHHAPQVEQVITPLSQEVRGRLSLGVDKIEVYERNGNLGNTCWVTLGGNRYCFSYNYQTGAIDLRNHSTQGAHRYDFDNGTSQAAIKREVAAL